MELTHREIWALVHGMLIGGPFLLAFSGVLVLLAGLREEELPAAAIGRRVRQLRVGSVGLAAASWAIVLTGTWVLLPWYAEDSPDSPRSVLLSDPATRGWHEFADVWKTHVAPIAPLLATAAAAVVVHYGHALARERAVRHLALALLAGAFAIASLAALIGSLVTRAAPLR